MNVVLWFLLIPAALVIDTILIVQFGVNQRVPFVALALILPALFFLFRALRKQFSKMRLLANIAAWLLTLGFLWWSLSYAEYGALSDVPKGAQLEAVESLVLPNHDGQPLALAEQLADSRQTLLVFYRGLW